MSDLHNLKNAFPKTPDKIRRMIEQEVQVQLHKEPTQEPNHVPKRVFSLKKTLAAALVATMSLGITVFACDKIYDWYLEKEGNYGLKAGIVSGTEDGAAMQDIPKEIPVLSFEAGYLPEDMVADESGFKFHSSDADKESGITITSAPMDCTDVRLEQIPLTENYVTYAEKFSIKDYNAIYLEREYSLREGIDYDKHIHIVCPEYWCVVSIIATEDISKEELVKFAEGLKIIPTGERVLYEDSVTWSERYQVEEEKEGLLENIVDLSDDIVDVTEMKPDRIHKVGDSFTILAASRKKLEGSAEQIQVKVTDVQIADNVSLLNEKYIENAMKKAMDAFGTLLPNEIQYIKQGNGIDSLNEVIYTETVGQKLVYVTVEYTNQSSADMEQVLIMAEFARFIEENGKYVRFDRAKQNLNENTDFCVDFNESFEMDYYDIHGGTKNNNYIPLIKAGETVTVHFAKLVNEDELDKMYLTLNTVCSDDSAYQYDYVDIRQ